MAEKDEEIVGDDLLTGREKAVAANKLRLQLMRRRGFPFKKAGETALHELTHATAVKGKRLQMGHARKGNEIIAFVKPKDALTPKEVLDMNTAVGPRMSHIDKSNARLARFFLFIENLFKGRK